MVQFYQGTPESVTERLYRTLSNLLFSYHWTEAHCYLRVGKQEDTPVDTDWKNHYFAGSFEKILISESI